MFRSTLTFTFLTVVALLVPVVNAFVLSSSSLHNTRNDAQSSRSLNIRQRGASRPSSSTTMMVEKNRKARRITEARKKKSSSTKGPLNPTKSSSSAKWLQVLDKAPEIEVGNVKVVSGRYKGEDKFFTLATHGGKYFAVSEACGRCKFPMINGKVKVLLGDGNAEDVKEGVEEDPDAEVAIGCPLCGAMFNLRTGSIAGEQPKGLAQLVVSKLVSQTAVESVTPYQTQALSSGAIVVRVD